MATKNLKDKLASIDKQLAKLQKQKKAYKLLLEIEEDKPNDPRPRTSQEAGI
jgi:sulfur transfer protein SufE